MASRYDSRRDFSAFKGEDARQALLLPSARDHVAERHERSVFEPLLRRLQYVGRGYGLPLLSRIGDYETARFPEVQFPSLEDELEFVLGTLSDGALHETVRAIHELLAIGARDRRGWTLVVMPLDRNAA